MKIRQLGAEFFACRRTERWKDRHGEAIITLSNFANASKTDRNNLSATAKKPCSEKNRRKVDWRT